MVATAGVFRALVLVSLLACAKAGADWYTFTGAAPYCMPLGFDTLVQCWKAKLNTHATEKNPQDAAFDWLSKKLEAEFPALDVFVPDTSLDGYGVEVDETAAVVVLFVTASDKRSELECIGPYETEAWNYGYFLRRGNVQVKAFDQLLLSAAASIGVSDPDFMPGVWTWCTNTYQWRRKRFRKADNIKDLSSPALTETALLDGEFVTEHGETVRCNRGAVAAANPVALRLFFGERAAPPGSPVTLPAGVTVLGTRRCLQYILSGDVSQLDMEVARAAEFFEEAALRMMCTVKHKNISELRKGFKPGRKSDVHVLERVTHEIE